MPLPPPPGSLSKWTPKNQFFERSTTQKPRNSVDGCFLSVMRVPSFLQGEKLFPEIKLQREKNVSKFSACFFMLNFARRSAKKSERLVDATILRSEIDLSTLVAACCLPQTFAPSMLLYLFLCFRFMQCLGKCSWEPLCACSHARYAHHPTL